MRENEREREWGREKGIDTEGLYVCERVTERKRDRERMEEAEN